MNIITDWLRRQFSNPQLVVLILILAAVVLTLYLAGDSLAPVLAATVIAYLLQGLVNRLENIGLPHFVAVHLVFVTFVATVSLAVFGLMPLLVGQLTQLVQQIPSMMSRARDLLLRLPNEYPTVFTEQQISDFIAAIRNEILGVGQTLLSYSVSSLVTLVTVVVYFILVPLMVYFMIKDKQRIVDWFSGFLPEDRHLSSTVWHEVDVQIANYVRGKFWEIIIVASFAYATFSLLDLQYALLLAALTGVSVLIPYIGAALVTVPVALVALFQWGLTPDFYWAVAAYLIIQALDGNLLAPLLFSEAVDLHPVAIIVAILFFGGLWGFWGVFFAIPLATVIQAILRVWPRAGGPEPEPLAAADGDQ
ncbi:MAG: AI-2E family transporter [Chromatiales bacterium]|jgi:putative permease